MASEAVAPEAPVAMICDSCGAGPNDPSIVDVEFRAWSAAPPGNRCHWCAQLIRIMEPVPADMLAQVPRRCTPEWQAFLTALFSMRLEGHVMPPFVPLNRRVQTLAQIAPIIATGTVAPSEAPSDRAGDMRLGQAAPAVEPPAYAFITPKKERSTASSAGDVLGEAPSPSPMCPSLASPTPSAKASPSPASSSSALPQPLAMPTLQAGLGEEVPMPQELNPLSLTAAMPACTLGRSLTRIRKTINGYVVRCGEPWWFWTFKKGTLKALERRLGFLNPDVQASMHVGIMSAYAQLRHRVASVSMLAKTLKAWLASGVESHLGTALKLRDLLAPCLNFFGMQWGDDLQIVFRQAEFWRQTSRNGGFISKVVVGNQARGRIAQ